MSKLNPQVDVQHGGATMPYRDEVPTTQKKYVAGFVANHVIQAIEKSQYDTVLCDSDFMPKNKYF